MRICFFGHAECNISTELNQRLNLLLQEYVKTEACEFLFGSYGRFDDAAFICVKNLTSAYNIVKSFVTPYITESYQVRLEYARHIYDQIIYPEIEKVPYKFAITARNKWMVEQCDLIICYINHSFGGAYNAVSYAKGRGKRIINLGSAQI